MASLVGSTVRGIRLIDELASGGMGEVYLGYDDRLQRKVAVKAIRSDRRLDAAAKARFLREARALSLLDHPNICRIYDYVEGEDSDFIVLEFAHGVTMRSRAERGMSHEEKLRAAIEVAEALVAAHAMSVVHRDLKPENVMVADDGHVKVLDFGLARPIRGADLGGEFTVRAGNGPAQDEPAKPGGEAVTEVGAVLGTPRYMSPEQARGEAVTAASDMYSFGLLLQELFTGRPPIPPDLAQPAMLQRAMWGESEPATGIDAPLAALIERMKSLAPRERPSAAVVLERLRWVADTPRRRVRRAAAAAVAIFLLGAAAISTFGFMQASRAKQRAEAFEAAALQAQADTEAVNAFLRSMLISPDPRVRGIDVKVVDVLGRAAESVERDFAGRFTSQATILDTLGSTYHALGEPRKARPLLERAVELRRRELGPTAPETLASMHRLGIVLFSLNIDREALVILREAQAARTTSLGADHNLTLETETALAQTLQSERQYEEAEALLRRVLEVRRRTAGPDAPATLEAMRALGVLLRDLRRFDEAEPLLEGSYQGARLTLGPSHLQTLDALQSLAFMYGRQKRFEEAVARLRDLRQVMLEVRGERHPTTLRITHALGRNLAELGRYEEGERLLRGALALQREVIGPAHVDTLETMRTLAYSATKQGKAATAERLWRERWSIARANLGDDALVTLECQSVVANALRAAGRYDEAERLFREVLAARQRTLGVDHVATISSRRDLARLLVAVGRVDEARVLDPSVGTAPDPAARPR